MGARATIRVEVAYARPEQQVVVGVTVPAGSTVAEAIGASKIAERFPEIDAERCDVGVFGKAVARDRVLNAGDRVEIYRPLLADPKEVRKLRAAQGKRTKRGGGDLGER